MEDAGLAPDDFFNGLLEDLMVPMGSKAAGVAFDGHGGGILPLRVHR